MKCKNPSIRDQPRYLPHMDDPRVLKMGLQPLALNRWIEPDTDWHRYHLHKQDQRKLLGDKVYRSLSGSWDAQEELADLLQAHLTDDHPSLFQQTNQGLEYLPAKIALPAPGREPLWNISLWVADDLLLLQEFEGRYRLTAASLASPSDWLLEEKFGQPLAAIHRPIPEFDASLTPSIDRFFHHLKPERPVQRFNWSLQFGDRLNRRPDAETEQDTSLPLFYRSERQTLRRLPRTHAVVFSIRVYVHPLTSLKTTPSAIDRLFEAIDNTPQSVARYKRFDTLAEALRAYRQD